VPNPCLAGPRLLRERGAGGRRPPLRSTEFWATISSIQPTIVTGPSLSEPGLLPAQRSSAHGSRSQKVPNIIVLAQSGVWLSHPPPPPCARSLFLEALPDYWRADLAKKAKVESKPCRKARERNSNLLSNPLNVLRVLAVR